MTRRLIKVICSEPCHKHPVTVARFAHGYERRVSRVGMVEIVMYLPRRPTVWVLDEHAAWGRERIPYSKASHPRVEPSDSRKETAHVQGSVVILPCTCGLRKRPTARDMDRLCAFLDTRGAPPIELRGIDYALEALGDSSP